jgi:PAS domain S-box-containing protein
MSPATRVLVVDDKEENLYYLRALLSAHGYQVEGATQGAEALVKARRDPPHVVISDLLMPVMDGYSLLRQWKADERLRCIPFVVYTATYTDPEDERLARHLGADAFILKPSEGDAFLGQIRAVLDETPVAPAAMQPGDETGLLREYSQTLIRKLEEKTLQLEATNKRLQADVAARQEAEAALRESEERFRQLTDSIEDAFWLSDLRGHVIYASPPCREIWGEAGVMAEGSPWPAAVHPDDRARVAATLAGTEPTRREESFRIVRAGGAVRWIRARTYPVRDASGQVYRVAGVARDITDYRRLEEQLRHGQKMEAIGRLAGGIAHDFNNLLSVILSYTTILIEDLTDPRLREELEQVRLAGERATELTRQLLAFSRQQVLEPMVVDVNQIVGRLKKMLERLLGEHIKLEVVESARESRVFADPGQLEQIVMNLVVNARDAMTQGGRLIIEIAERELLGEAAEQAGLEPGRYVVLAVTDTGQGMEAGIRERIFEPFFTTKELGKGTGLGLSTVFGIVEQSQGHIEVTSEPARGTTFRIYLPRTDRPAEVRTAPRPAPATLRGTETVLLVEDDDQVRETTGIVLGRSGYRVIEAQNGEEALAVTRRMGGGIHLLVTDVVMPRMNGRELAERLAEVQPALKAIYLSGYTGDAVVHAGAIDPRMTYLQKPVAPELLLRKVREMLDRPA